MTITPGIAKRLRALLSDVSKGAVGDEVEAAFLLQKLEPRRPLKPKSKRPSMMVREWRRKARAEAAAGFRHQVMSNAGNHCELAHAASIQADEAHHVISGSGSRRAHESPGTGVALCWMHHDWAHANDRDTLEQILALMEKRGETYAAHCIRRRIDKLGDK